MTSTTSSRRPSRLAARALRALPLLAVALAIGLLAGTAAAGTEGLAVKPPKGIPDLSKMALTTTDLGSARVARQGYVKPSEGVVAAYVREFGAGTGRVGSKRLAFAESDIDLVRTVADAKLFIEFVPLGFALLDPEEIAAGLAQEGIRATYVRIGTPARLRAGDQGFSVMVRVGTKLGEIRFLFGFVRVDRVVATIGLMGLPKVKLTAGDAAVLGRLVSRHVREALAPVAAAPPAISGTPQVGQTLTASRGSWTNTPTRLAYRWQRCDAAGASCVDVAGATAQTYAPGLQDLGLTLRVGVTATNAFGSTTAYSAPTAPVLPAPGSPSNVSPPTISGTVAVGQVLTADPGTWTGSPTGYAYAWRRCDASGLACADIAGATAQTYTLVAADSGSTIRVAVTATNASGAAIAVSAQTALVP